MTQPLNVACDLCHAPAGQKCFTLVPGWGVHRRRIKMFHKGRSRKAHEIALWAELQKVNPDGS